jgi:hypothetical protein
MRMTYNLDPAIRDWRPSPKWGFLIGAGVSALLGCLKVQLLLNSAAQANIGIHDLAAFWTLATSNPPPRALAPLEVVLFRRCVSVLISAVSTLLLVVLHLVSLKRRRAELAMAAYLAGLESPPSHGNSEK